MGIALEQRLNEKRLAKAALTTADLGGAGESPLSLVQVKGPCPTCSGRGGRHERGCAVGDVAKAVCGTRVQKSLDWLAVDWEAELGAPGPVAKEGTPADKTPEPFSTSKTSNWVAKLGGLPNYIQHVAHAMVSKGMDVSRAIGMAIGIIKNWAHGKGKVSAAVRAAAQKALAQWDAMKAAAHAS